MAEFRLTPAAERDLESIWTYTVQQWVVEQAIRYTDFITAAFAELALSPESALACDFIRIESAGVLSAKGVRPALATALFRDGHLSLVGAAQLAEPSVSGFVSHVSRLGIPVVKLEGAEAAKDIDTLNEWLASS